MVDILQPFIPAPFEGVPPRHNLWRVDDTLIIYQRGEWKRVRIDSEDAKAWAAFLVHPTHYRTWTYRLQEYVKTHREIQETVERAEVEAFLSRCFEGQDTIKRAYMQIAQIAAKEIISQRFGDATRVPKEDVRQIVEHVTVMCVEFYEDTLQMMEG